MTLVMVVTLTIPSLDALCVLMICCFFFQLLMVCKPRLIFVAAIQILFSTLALCRVGHVQSLLMQGIMIFHFKKVKVKASHTRYRALGPELIPVYRQSARR